jgi:predicted ArsR family transcriptional regulator
MSGFEEKVLSLSSRRKVLEELIKSEEATAYQIAKKLNIPDSAVGKHLAILYQARLVQRPIIDTSEGRLKKLYKPAEDAERILMNFWLKEIESAPESVKKRIYMKLAEREGA